MSSDPTILDCKPTHGWPSWFERVPLARWGWRELNLFGWPLVGITIILVLLGPPWCWASIVPLASLGQLFYFFRDPKRSIPEGPNLIVAPADGKVTDITTLERYDFFDGPAVRIGIFLSVFNVHINRAPFGGRVVETNYRPGEFLNALRADSAERNEFMWIGLERTDGSPHRFAVRQISGMLARRIVCELGRGSVASRGEKFGMIKLGSRTELILPAGAVQVRVRAGDKVRAGSDVVANWIDR